MDDELKPQYELELSKAKVNRLVAEKTVLSEPHAGALGKRLEQLLRNLERAHDAYYRSAVFGGPSLYFHQAALRAAELKDFERFSEMSYAVLTAWGMHRMGRGGSKMREFDDFHGSLKLLWPLILNLQQQTPDDLGESGWEELEKVFRELRCMATGTSLVGNSKVMAHALPNLIPPVDREYTLRLLLGNKNIKNDPEREWLILKSLLQGFFYPMLRAEAFIAKASKWMLDLKNFPWDTSTLKVTDNLIIGFMKIDNTEDVENGARLK